MNNSLYTYSVYQSVISGINIVEINLEILTSNFDSLSQEDRGYHKNCVNDEFTI
ncbi:MAG: hypothetical protein ACJAZX_001248 [Rickettsiales bacterium]|jgi:hypothetical protein